MTFFPSYAGGRSRWILFFGVTLAGCAAPKTGVKATRQGASTVAEMPQMAHSNESTEAQLDLARKQGYAIETALKWLITRTAPTSGQQAAGEYSVAYTLSSPEGFYKPGSTDWQRPPSEATAHLRVFVRDGADGRTVPGLQVRATFTDAAGRELISRDLPYGWYPLVESYGDNVALPTGTYKLRLSVSAMPFRRHDPYNGERHSHSIVAEFMSVPMTANLTERPPLTEAEEKETTLAKAQGDTYDETTQAMYAQANDGKNKPMGAYRVGYAIEYAEAYWYFPSLENRKTDTPPSTHTAHMQHEAEKPSDGKLRYTGNVEASGERNCHVEVAILEQRTGRFVPGLHVRGTLYDSKGQDLKTYDVPFMWHPWLYHYGENWRVRGDGQYRLHVHVDAPPFRRFGRETGRALASAIDTDFEGVKILAGQK